MFSLHRWKINFQIAQDMGRVRWWRTGDRDHITRLFPSTRLLTLVNPLLQYGCTSTNAFVRDEHFRRSLSQFLMLPWEMPDLKQKNQRAHFSSQVWKMSSKLSIQGKKNYMLLSCVTLIIKQIHPSNAIQHPPRACKALRGRALGLWQLYGELSPLPQYNASLGNGRAKITQKTVDLNSHLCLEVYNIFEIMIGL